MKKIEIISQVNKEQHPKGHQLINQLIFVAIGKSSKIVHKYENMKAAPDKSHLCLILNKFWDF